MLAAEDRQDRRRQHPADDRAADRVLPARAGTGRDGERQHAEDEREAGHQDRAQAQLGGFDHRLERVLAVAHPFLGEFDDQDRVLCRHADRRDEADLEIDVIA